MLGDGCYYNAGHTADISFGHKQDHSQYVDWCLQGLGDVGMPTSPTVSGYRTEMVRGRTTRSHFIKKEFEDFFQRMQIKFISQKLNRESIKATRSLNLKPSLSHTNNTKKLMHLVGKYLKE